MPAQRTRRKRRPLMTPEALRRRLHQAILVLYLAASIGAVAMVAGPLINDWQIGKDPGRALATVTDVGMIRTSVAYQDEDGIYHAPPTGLLYPTGLGEGQQVWVTYARDNPELVKVEGREWTLAVIPALSTAVVASVMAVLAWWSVNSWMARRGRAKRVNDN